MFRGQTVSASKESPSWYALRVRSNCERLTSAHLRHRGIEEFAPTFKAERQWSDRKKQVDQFLFSGYVFCQLDPQHRVPVLSIPGAVSLVSFGNGPAPIPAEEIEAVRRITNSGLLVAPWPFLQVGQSVVIERGPLTGVEGILQKIQKSFRLVVSVELLQRSVSAEVDRSWVRPVGASPGRTLSMPAGPIRVARAR